jgi:hypothetical protein
MRHPHVTVCAISLAASLVAAPARAGQDFIFYFSFGEAC